MISSVLLMREHMRCMRYCRQRGIIAESAPAQGGALFLRCFVSLIPAFVN